jgi:cobalt-zinc-cadmium efflux system protein
MAHHSDAHHHPHHGNITRVNNAFIIGIILNTLFVAVEFVVGYYQSSLALISDAGHNLTDVFGLVFSLFAFRMMKVKPTATYSYGFKKISILASLLNAILLIGTTAFIFYEGFVRIRHQEEVQGSVMSLVALIGIVVNGVSAFLFLNHKGKDINVRSSYLHLLSDALVSLGVVITGIIIYFTGLYWLDTVISFAIGIVILGATWRLLNDSLRLALDGTPINVDLNKVKEMILSFPEITNVHHIHIWALSSDQNAMTAHLVIRENDVRKFEQAKHEVKHRLEHLNIHHTTFEVEPENCEEDC